MCRTHGRWFSALSYSNENFHNVQKLFWDPKTKSTEKVQSINITLDGEQKEMRGSLTCIREFYYSRLPCV